MRHRPAGHKLSHNDPPNATQHDESRRQSPFEADHHYAGRHTDHAFGDGHVVLSMDAAAPALLGKMSMAMDVAAGRAMVGRNVNHSPVLDIWSTVFSLIGTLIASIVQFLQRLQLANVYRCRKYSNIVGSAAATVPMARTCSVCFGTWRISLCRMQG